MNNKRVLVCEDDEPIADVIKIILEENGYEVLIANSTKKINNKLLKFHPRLILMDVLMSGENGRGVTKRLKRENETRDIPIILVSAVADLEKITTEVGADGFLSKPFEMDRLLEVVAKNIN